MLDIPQNTIPDIWPTHARHHPAGLALVFDERSYDWGAFDRLVSRAAQGFRDLGVRKGERVAFYLRNSPDYLFMICGALAAGACVAPLSTLLTHRQAIDLANDSGARLFFCDEDVSDAFAAARREFTHATTFLTAGEKPGWQSWSRLFAQAPDPSWRSGLALDDESNINYSSGTTGIPKGVIQSHRARQHWALTFAAGLGIDDGSISLCTTPLYSNATWLLLLPWLLTGGTAVIMSRFDTHAFRDTVERWKVSHTFMVPTQFRRLLDELEDGAFDHSSMSCFLTAGSPMSAATKLEVMNRLGPKLYELYGMSEGGATLAKPRDLARVPSTVGRPMPGFEVRILGDSGNDLPPGADGEIAFHGGWAMSGYNNNDAATRETIWRDGAGRTFIKSGDIGRIDEEGLVYVHDRKKDMIISGGFNVFPIDIERVLETHPLVADVAVIGVPHPKWGETVCGIVVLADGGEADPEEIRSWANARLAATQRIARIVIEKELPRNPTGKVLKRTLRDRYANSAAPS